MSINTLALMYIAREFLPAMIAAMCVGGRLVDALNPAVVLAIARRIPRAYLMLVACIAAVWA